ncbi:hypothetical protein [Leuconostoc lactis]|uniref:hypothetical protein n=1 Tax=Leuconostoc lactis TaxID=1246 RepID=UPI00102241DB|nr:hypothetical protein [Leuconostoc lactis]MSB65617.1 hypothetical protein [Leuconostoc lactis]RYS84927.1 hypothetical protein EAI73_08290 [Leuconostoc lactis]
MTREKSKRKEKLDQYLEQLDEFSWHHPTRVKDMANSMHERKNRTYYLAQISLILFHNYQQSYIQISTLLHLSSRTVYKFINDNPQDFESLDEIKKALDYGENW